MKEFIPLNLPEYSFRIRKKGKNLEIFDFIRKKFVTLTPEEWVRQNFIRYLIEEKKYSPSRISIETSLKYSRLHKRSDITIYDKNGNPWMIIECKNPSVAISQKTFNQVAIYNMSQKTRAKYLTVTNGLIHYCCEMHYESGSYLFVKDLPECN
jgi:hypothetical protein